VFIRDIRGLKVDGWPNECTDANPSAPNNVRQSLTRRCRLT